MPFAFYIVLTSHSASLEILSSYIVLTYVSSSGPLEMSCANIWHNGTDVIFVKSIFRRVCTAIKEIKSAIMNIFRFFLFSF